MILEVRNLSFRYENKGRQILEQFSLQADSNERVGIAAPSGFGKTTLCKLLAGYEQPESEKFFWMENYYSPIKGTARYR